MAAAAYYHQQQQQQDSGYNSGGYISPSIPPTIVWDNNVLTIEHKIGAGTFGQIYRGKLLQTGEYVAVKFEDAKSQHPQLHFEKRVYSLLKLKDGFPKLRWYGSTGLYNVLVMDLLGPSLEDLFNYCKRRFSLKTVLLIGCQAINRLEAVHSKGYIHRDIKPDNFVMGINDHHKLYLIDFGLSKLYRDPRTWRHIPHCEGKSLVGTARYASNRAHRGHEHSRRDDMESLGYVLLYFLKGQLPWQNMKAATKKQKFDKIYEIKESITMGELCFGCPMEFVRYMGYVRNLAFNEEPNYKYLYDMFLALFNSRCFLNDNRYDWVEVRDETMRRRVEQARLEAIQMQTFQQLFGGMQQHQPGRQI